MDIAIFQNRYFNEHWTFWQYFKTDAFWAFFQCFKYKALEYSWQYFKTEALWAFFGGKIEALNAVW